MPGRRTVFGVPLRTWPRRHTRHGMGHPTGDDLRGTRPTRTTRHLRGHPVQQRHGCRSCRNGCRVRVRPPPGYREDHYQQRRLARPGTHDARQRPRNAPLGFQRSFPVHTPHKSSRHREKVIPRADPPTITRRLEADARNGTAGPHGLARVTTVSGMPPSHDTPRPPPDKRQTRASAVHDLLYALREFERFHNSHRQHQGITNARPHGPCPKRSPIQGSSPASTNDDANDSAASSTSTNMLPEPSG